MSQLEFGKYTIIKPDVNGGRLTLEEGDDNFIVTLQPPMRGQTWVMIQRSDSNYVIENADFNGAQFLAPTDVKNNALLTVTNQPFEWRIQQSGAPNQYHIVVPGGPVDGEELAVDLSTLRIFPQKVALRPLEVHNNEQAWFLAKEGN